MRPRAIHCMVQMVMMNLDKAVGAVVMRPLSKHMVTFCVT